jgi:YVTN family beta-propeller protein
VPDRRQALVTVQKADHCLSLYDVGNGTELAQIELPEYPHEFALSPDRSVAYVGHYGVPTQFDEGEGGCSIFVIDLQRGEVVRTLRCWPYFRIHGLAADAGGRVFALSEGSGALLVFERPWESERPDRVLKSGGRRSHILTVTRDGRLAFSVNVLSDTVTVLHPFEPQACPHAIHIGQQPEGSCLSLDERYLYVANRRSNSITQVDVATFEVVRRAGTGLDPARVLAIADGRLLVTNYGEFTIGVYDGFLNRLGAIDVDANPIAVGADARTRRGYATLNNATVAVIDLDRLEVMRYFPVRDEPDGVAIVDVREEGVR